MNQQKINLKKPVDERIKGYKTAIQFFTEMKEVFYQKGQYFALYFKEMYETANGKPFDQIRKYRDAITELEDSYINLRENEDAEKLAAPTIRQDIIAFLHENSNVFSREVYKHFDEKINSLVSRTLYDLIQQGIIVRILDGKSYRLKISDTYKG